MGYDRSAPKRALNLALNEDLVRQAASLSGDLSATIEGLLDSYVEAEAAKRADLERQIDQWIAASNAFVAEHGVFGEEYSTL